MLSLRDVVVRMADRGITLTHSTIVRWVPHDLPEFEKRENPNYRAIAATQVARTLLSRTPSAEGRVVVPSGEMQRS